MHDSQAGNKNRKSGSFESKFLLNNVGYILITFANNTNYVKYFNNVYARFVNNCHNLIH